MANQVHIDLDPGIPRVTARGPRGDIVLPALWLRERCQDPEQVDRRTRQRLFNPHALPADLALTGVDGDGAGRAWLSFSDGYRGCYELAELAAELEPVPKLPPARQWHGGFDRREVTFDWPALDDDAGLLATLGAFLRRGFLVLRRVPTDRERILDVARRFGYPRDTNFGRYFEVYSRPDANDLAYASVALGPHTDNPYREPVPGIQLLHCLVNEVEGGLSTLADSLAVCERLASEDPEGFERLATTPVAFRFRDTGEDLVEQRSIIRRDADGAVTGLHYSPRLDSLPLLDEAALQAFHRARQRLGKLLVDPAFELRFPLRQGELLLFDNSRIVHGRSAFDSNGGRRHLQGCYIDLDEPRSRYRVLARCLAPDNPRREAQ